MFHYHAYNLNISSQIELPGLPVAAAGDDVVIRFQPRDAEAGPPPQMARAYHVTPRFATLDYATLGTLTLRNGCTIDITLCPDADESLLPSYLTREAMAVLLYQRGLIVLQASAVTIRGTTAVFLAGRGGGKSTIAARLHQEGHTLLAEDITAIDMGSGEPVVIPATPTIQLDLETADALGQQWSSAGLVNLRERKGTSLVARGFADRPAPLGVVYQLQVGAAACVGHIPFQMGLAAILHGSYPTCLLQPGGIGYLQQCRRLAGAVSICALTRPGSLRELPGLVDVIECHVLSHALI